MPKQGHLSSDLYSDKYQQKMLKCKQIVFNKKPATNMWHQQITLQKQEEEKRKVVVRS